jgi:hypothetical protein
MSALGNLNTASDVKEDVDSLGGNGPWESGLYPVKVAMAFLRKSAGGAQSVVLHLNDEAGRELRQTLWIASGDAKGNKTYYETKDGEKKNLPGFTTFRQLCLMTINKDPQAANHGIEVEEKVIKLWDREASAEVPTTVDCLVELLGQEIIAGVLKQVVNKNVQDDNGKYVPSGETREENEIDKFFHAATRMTLAEATGGKTEGEFIDNWDQKFTGTVKDRSTGATAPTSGGARPAAAAGTPPVRQSLFG